MPHKAREQSTGQRQRLSLEPLEPRLLLSGNIVAAISGSAATLIGDADPNKFLVEQLDPQTLRITGNDGTTVNGAGGAQTIATTGTTVLQNLTIRTGDGDDEINMNVLAIPGSLYIDTGPGKTEVPVSDNDKVTLTNVRADKRITLLFQNGNNKLIGDGINSLGDFIATTGSGNDDLKIKNVNVGKSVRAYLGDGVNGADFDSTTTGKDMTLQGGPGDDTVDLSGINAPGSLRIYAGDGTNDVDVDGATLGKDLWVQGGLGDDSVDVSNANATGSGRLYASEGTNTIDVEDGVFGKAIAITSGLGGDTIAVSSTRAVSSLSIAAGGGANTVELFDLDLPGYLRVTTGEGADTLEADSLIVGGATQFATAGGNDTIDIEREEPGDAHASTFTGRASILAGAGDNDVVRIGTASEASNLATFLAASVADGGLGITDTLLLGNVVGPLLTLNFEA